MRRNEYDPGSPYDPPPRRRRRLGDEYDDAWAGGDDDDSFDDAAGYTWEDAQTGTRHSDDDFDEVNVPPARRRSRRRYPAPDSPSYHRDLARRGEYGEYYEKPKRIEPDRSYRQTGPRIPYWQILMLVILGLAAFLVTVLACVSILSL